MRNIKSKSQWTRVLAALSAAVMVFTSLGAMPVVSATEIGATTIVPLIDFNSYETANLGIMDAGNLKNAYITTWSGVEPRFQVQNDSGKIGTVTANIASKEGVASDKYFDKNVLIYEESGTYLLPAMLSSINDTPIVDTEPDTGDADESGVLKTTGLALNYQNDAVNTGMSKIALTQGEQLVYEVSVHSDKYFSMYDRRSAKGSDSTTNILNHLFWVENGKLYVNDGTRTSYDKSKALGSVTLPTGRWIDLRFVYTAGDGVHKNGNDDTVRVYVNGKLTALEGDGASATGVNTLASDFLGAPTQRLTFSGGSTFDNFKVTKYNGKMYTDEIPPEPEIVELVPTLSFDGWTADTTQPTKGGTVFNTTYNGGTAVAGTNLYVGNTTVDPRVANYTGDAMADVAGKGKISGDAYFMGTQNVQYRTYDNSSLNAKSGLTEGDQMVISFQTLTSKNFTIYTRYAGKRWVSTDNTVNGKPEGAPAAVELNNFNCLISISGGKIQVQNGEPNDNETSYAYNGTPYKVNDDTVAREELTDIPLPQNQWVTVTMVYTAGAQTVTTGSASAAEVMTVPEGKEDTVEVYVNNIKVLGRTALTENNLFRKIDRFDFQGNGCFDNFDVKLYKTGARFEPETIPGADMNAAKTAAWYGPNIYAGIAKTASSVVADIEEIDTVADCTLIDASGSPVADAALANTADFAVIKGMDGKVYTAKVVDNTDLSSAFAATTFTGDETMDKRDKDGVTSHPEVGTDYAKFGKADGNKAYTWTPYASGDDWIWQRAWVDGEVNVSNPLKGTELFGAVPMYISFDILYDDTVTDFSKGNSLVLSGAAVTRDAQTATIIRSGGTNFIIINIDDGIKIKTNNGENSTGVEVAASGNHKQWYNVTMQLWPYTNSYEVYVDGVLVHNGTFFGDFLGINNLYFNVYQNGFWLDNFIITGGVYEPAPKAEINLTVDEDTSGWAEGIGWNAEGKFIETNKSARAIAYSAAIADNFSTDTVGAEIMFINATGEKVTAATENGTIDQIVVRGSDGGIHYYGVKPRTGMRRINVTPDGDEGQRWLIDIADGYGEQYEDFIVYVARYSGDNRLLVRCDPYEVTEANVDGDTWFIDVPADKAIENGDKVFVWSTDGKITPIYKE